MAATRYPGVSSFEDNELASLLFFGREEDSKRLFYHILSDVLTVLYSKSGYGKTSLLQARVFGMLREQNHYPVFVRFNKRNNSPGEVIRSEVMASSQKGYEVLSDSGSGSLNSFFKELEIWSPVNKLQTPVIILDQFEEIFTLEHNQPYRVDFFRQLAEVLNEAKEGRQKIRFVISIREDYLGYLENMAVNIPSIFSNRFRLRPLTKEGAAEAIEKPGKTELPGIAFNSPQMHFASDALEQLKTFLSLQLREGEWVETDEVEPIQLQIICSELEERAIEEKTRKNIHICTITKKDLKGEEKDEDGLKKILGTFYTRQLQKAQDELSLAREEIIAIRNLVEKELIVGKRRVPQDYEAILERKNPVAISREALELLIKNKLLKVEKYQQSSLVELTHDALIDPVLKAYDSRKEREELIKKKMELLENKKRLKKSRYTAALLTLLLIVSAALAVSVLHDNNIKNDKIKYLQNRYFSSAVQTKKTNPTFAYLIARKGYDKDSTTGYLDSLLKDFDAREDFYMEASFRIPGEVIAASLFPQDDHIFITTYSYGFDYNINGILDKRLSLNDQYCIGTGQRNGKKIFVIITAQEEARVKDENNATIAVFRLDEENADPQVCAVSGDGNKFIIGNCLYTTGRKDPVTRFKHWSELRGAVDVQFSRDGRYIISSHWNSRVLVQDISGKILQMFHHDSENAVASAVAVTSDFNYLVSTGRSSANARIWQLDTSRQENLTVNWKALTELNGHIAPVNCVAISPDNRYIVTGSDDNTAIVWDFQGNIISVLRGHTGKLSYVGFAADSRKIITGTENGEVMIWVFGKASALYRQKKLAEFCPLDYYSAGINDYTVRQIYDTSGIQNLYLSILSYGNHFPGKNLFPSDNIYLQALRKSIKELDTLYNALLHHPQLNTGISRPNRRLMYERYADFIIDTSALLLKTNEATFPEKVRQEAMQLEWKKKALVIDTGDYFRANVLMHNYYNFCLKFYDSIRVYPAFLQYVDSAKKLVDMVLSKYRDSTEFLNLGTRVYLLSSETNFCLKNSDAARSDAIRLIGLCKDLVKTNQDNVMARMMPVQAWLLSGKYEEAFQALRSAVQQKPRDQQMYYDYLEAKLEELQKNCVTNSDIEAFLNFLNKRNSNGNNRLPGKPG